MESKDLVKGKSKKRYIIIAVVAIFVALCVGLGIWHEKPTFCATCHTPMDPYVDTYYAEPGQPTIDKYGNEVANADGMLVVTHRIDGEEGCMDCHKPSIGQQITEGMHQITGNYVVYANDTYPGGVLGERSAAELLAGRGVKDAEAVSDSFCMNKACHTNEDGSVMTRDDLIELTSDMKFNPHVVEHEQNQCTDCHKAHRASVMQCARCHSEAEIPEGWVRTDEVDE